MRVINEPLRSPSTNRLPFASGKIERAVSNGSRASIPRTFLSWGDDYLRVAGNNAVDNGQRTFEFHAVTPGAHQLVFEKRMGWKFTAEDRRVFTIDVSNGSRS